MTGKNPPPSILQAALQEHGVLLADGATGTNLFALGLTAGEAPEIWNLTQAHTITQHYQRFIDAGVDILLTNSFGANSFRLALHGYQDRVVQLNQTAAQLARAGIQQANKNVLIAGSIGPTGELPEPMGSLTQASAVAAFAEQAKALKAGGADFIWIETMSSLEEAQWALEGVKQADLEAICTFSFDTHGRSMMGVTPAHMLNTLTTNNHRHDLVACGSNCGLGAAEVVVSICNFAQAQTDPPTLLVAKANCGLPEYVDGKIEYQGTYTMMADYACLAIDAGASIVGGCCGTTPSHVAAMRHAIDTHVKGTPPSQEEVVARLGSVTAGATKQLDGQQTSVDKPTAKRQRRGRQR